MLCVGWCQRVSKQCFEGFQESVCVSVNVCVCAVRNTCVTAGAERICFCGDTDGWIDRDRERKRERGVVKLFPSLLLSSVSCLLPSLDHEVWKQRDVFKLKWSFICFPLLAPRSLLGLLLQTLLSFPFLSSTPPTSASFLCPRPLSAS